MGKVTRKEIISACISTLENSNFQTDFRMRPINKWPNGKGFGWAFDKKIKMIYTFTMEKNTIKVVSYAGDAYGVVWQYELPENITANEVAEIFMMEFKNYLSIAV